MEFRADPLCTAGSTLLVSKSDREHLLDLEVFSPSNDGPAVNSAPDGCTRSVDFSADSSASSWTASSTERLPSVNSSTSEDWTCDLCVVDPTAEELFSRTQRWR